MRRTFVLAVCLVALPLYAGEMKPVTKGEVITVKTTIEAIDHEARTVTLMDRNGTYETVYAGPEIKRFDELKVGDKVTFTYSESVAIRIRKPGEPVPAATTSEPVITQGTSARPSGSKTQQMTAAVTIEDVNPKEKSITYAGEDGRSINLRVEDKKMLKNLHPGDKVEVTYTNALLINVE